MLSRVADSLYWMTRYLERAEHTARVVNIQLNLMLERGRDSGAKDWMRTLRSLGVEMDEVQPEQAQQLTLSLVHETSNRASIVACVVAARENARQVREQISTEMWEQLNRLFHAVRRAETEEVWETRDFLQSIKDGAHLFQGITDSTMTHGDGWQFIQAGRHLERAVSVSKVVREHFREFYQAGQVAQGSEPEYIEWVGLLRSCTAFESYCKVYTADLKPHRIAEFLVLHQYFPHSVRFSVEALEAALHQIGSDLSVRRSSPLERLTGRLRATLGFGQIDEIMRDGLPLYLEGVLRQCMQVHSALYQTYIAYPIEAALGA